MLSLLKVLISQQSNLELRFRLQRPVVPALDVCALSKTWASQEGMVNFETSRIVREIMGNRVAKLLQYSRRTPSCAKRNCSPAARTDHPLAKIT